MVTSTISGTRHHEVKLARVNLFKNISFIICTVGDGRLGIIIASNANTISSVRSSYFDFSSKYVRWLYAPSERHKNAPSE